MNSETRFDRLMKLKEKIDKIKEEINGLKRFLSELEARGACAISRSIGGDYIGDYAREVVKSYVPKIRESVEKRIQYLETLIYNTKKMF